MKKLVAVSAMAALLAGAAFAVDFSGTGKITFDALKIDNSGAWTLLDTPADGSTAGFSMSSEDGKAGAKINVKVKTGTTHVEEDAAGLFSGSGLESVVASKETDDDGKIYIAATGDTYAVLDAGIWFKPIDVLKVTVSSGKYAVDVDLDPLTLGGSLTGPVANKAADTPSWMGYAGYKMEGLSVKGTLEGKKAKADLKATVEVNTTLIPSVDLTVKNTTEYTKDTLEVTAAEEVSSLKLKETVTTVGNYNGSDGATVKAKLEVETPLADLTAYASVEHEDLVKFTESATTGICGVKGAFGVMSWDAGLKVVGTPADSKCEINVPVTLSVAF